jgi:fructose-specific phosphotransferase system IIC component
MSLLLSSEPTVIVTSRAASALVTSHMIRKSICCMLAGLLIAGSSAAFAHAYWTDWAATPSIVPTVAIVAGVIGVAWLYEELLGQRRRDK